MKTIRGSILGSKMKPTERLMWIALGLASFLTLILAACRVIALG